MKSPFGTKILRTTFEGVITAILPLADKAQSLLKIKVWITLQLLSPSEYQRLTNTYKVRFLWHSSITAHVHHIYVCFTYFNGLRSVFFCYEDAINLAENQRTLFRKTLFLVIDYFSSHYSWRNQKLYTKAYNKIPN